MAETWQEIEDECALCGVKHGDIPYDRVWICQHPDAETLREEIAGKEMIRETKEKDICGPGGYRHSLFSNGVAPHITYEVMKSHGTLETKKPNSESPEMTFVRNGI